MKRIFISVFSLCMALPVISQLQTPQPSPGAMVMQTVGVTEMSIDYSSPAVRDRIIWGELVPYGEIWRMGANSSTKFKTSNDVKIGGKTLAAGTYSLGAIPGKEKWTLIFNKETELGSWDDYDKTEDALRIEVKPMASPMRERLTFLFSNTTMNSTRIDMEWERTRISFDVEVPTHDIVMSAIEEALEPSARTYMMAARYTLDSQQNLEEGLRWAAKADDLSDSWYYSYMHAELLYANDKKKEALKKMQEAYDTGMLEPENFFYKERIESRLADWKKK